jgi:hypothetical protein
MGVKNKKNPGIPISGCFPWLSLSWMLTSETPPILKKNEDNIMDIVRKEGQGMEKAKRKKENEKRKGDKK